MSRSGTTSFDSFRVKTERRRHSPATPWVSVGDVTVTEGGPGAGATATVTLTLSQAATTATSVAWTTVNGTGTAGADYIASSGIATFAAGSTTAQITVSVVGDSVSELDELFSIALLGTTKLNLGRDAATVTILNDDKPSLSVTDATITEGNTGSANVTLTVALSAVYSGTVTVSYATVAGTAWAGSDYTAVSGTLTFSSGQTSKTVTIAVIGNLTHESTETFTLQLSNPIGATIAKGTGTVTIVDNDGALTASAAAPAGTAAPLLTQSALDAAVSSAKAEWLSADPDADFSGVTISISDLPELQLGLTDGRAITIDATAAGWGWGTSGMDLTHRRHARAGSCARTRPRGRRPDGCGARREPDTGTRPAGPERGGRPERPARGQAHPGPAADPCRGPFPRAADPRSSVAAAAGPQREDDSHWDQPPPALGPAPHLQSTRVRLP